MSQPTKVAAPLIGVFLFISICISSGCATYQVRGPHSDPSGQPQQQTVHSLFWGLMYSPQVVNTGCEFGIDQVEVHRHLGHDLISVLTLGFWSPIEIEYTCVSAEPPDIVDFPEAEDSDEDN